MLPSIFYAIWLYRLRRDGRALEGWFLLPLYGMVAFFLFRFSAIKHRIEETERAQQRKIEMLEGNYRMLLEIYREREIHVHDMKNHMRAIEAMLENAQVESAVTYIRQIVGDMNRGAKIAWTNHEMLDMVLNMKFQEARKEQIEVQCRCDDMSGLLLSSAEICALVRPTGGEMKLFGASSEKELQQKRRKMGALIEHPAIYTNLSAYQNLDIQRRYLDMDSGKDSKEVKKTLTELLDLVGLADVGDRKAGKFSLGMRQRLGIAIALVGQPEFLILDEPTIGLDPIGVMELRELVHRLNREREITILFSSHNLAELAQIATRYGFLHKGKLLEVVSAEEVGQICRDRGINLETYFVELLLKAQGGRKG